MRRVLVGALAATFAAAAAYLPAVSATAAASGTFSVLTYNIAGLPEGISSAPTPRAPATTAIGERLGPYDVIHVQEDFNYHSNLYAADSHPYRTPTSGGAGFGSGLNSLSAYWYDADDFERVRWNSCNLSEADCLTPKGFTFMRLRLAEGVYVDLYNVHTDAGSTDSDLEVRADNLRQLTSFIATHSSGNAVVVMGDTNTRYTRTGDTIASFVATNGLTDAWVKLARGGVPPAMGSPPLVCDPSAVTNSCEVVDKVLYRGSRFVSLDAMSYNNDHAAFLDSSGRMLSDHDPITVRFAWSTNPAFAFSEQFGGPHGDYFNDIDLVPAGGRATSIQFRADQVGTYWYHTHHASHVGVHKGLYGTLVVKPPSPVEPVDLTLPVHTFDGAVVIAGRDGRTEHPAPPGTPVRLRLVNTDSGPHRIVLAGTPFRVAAVDGRDLNQPGEVGDVGLRLPAGGRYDLVFAMPGTSVALVVDEDRDGGLVLRPPGDAPGDARIRDTSDRPELDLLRYGAPAVVPFDPRDADRHFTMVLDRAVAIVDGRPAYAHTVNGRGHPAIPDQLVADGDIVRFTVVNRSLETHPWHLHGHPVLVLSRDGTPSTGSPLWMDTFDVRPGETWEVVLRATNPGIWMNHCHNLPHAHQGMMLRLRYDGVTTPFGGLPSARPGHDH